MKKVRRRIRDLSADARKAQREEVYQQAKRAANAPLVRIREVKETLYLFDQLIAANEAGSVSGRAVDRAREWLQEGTSNYDWSEFMIETWKSALAQTGFEDAEIAFTGFCSQGDGASFTSDNVDLAKLIGFMLSDCLPENCIKAHPDRPKGEQEDFRPYVKHKIGRKSAQCTDNRYDRLLWFDDGDIFCNALVTRHSSSYSHFNTCRFECEFQDRGSTNEKHEFVPEHPKIYELFQEFAYDAEELRVQLCHAIYRDLETEYDYLRSDEALIESCRANEWYFDKHGEHADA